MIKTKIPYLGGEFIVEEDEPTTLAEITAVAGEMEVVRRFVKHLRYHYKYPRVYAEVARQIAPMLERGVDEDDGAYIKRYLKLGESARQTLQMVFASAATTEPLFPFNARSGHGKVSQGAMDAATKYFADGKQDAITESIEAELVGYSVQRDANGHVTVEGLARGIQKLNQQLVRQAKEKVKTILT